MPFGYDSPATGTDQELLDLTRAAIAKIVVGGQAYGSDGRTLTRADLAELRRTEEWLEQRIAAAEGNGLTVNYAERPGRD